MVNQLSHRDAAKLLRWAMLWGGEHPEDGPEVRKLVTEMRGMLLACDLLMLAKLANAQGQGWLGQLLRETAGMSHDED